MASCAATELELVLLLQEPLATELELVLLPELLVTKLVTSLELLCVSLHS
jgi:hypothetical protein